MPRTRAAARRIFNDMPRAVAYYAARRQHYYSPHDADRLFTFTRTRVNIIVITTPSKQDADAIRTTTTMPDARQTCKKETYVIRRHIIAELRRDVYTQRRSRRDTCRATRRHSHAFERPFAARTTRCYHDIIYVAAPRRYRSSRRATTQHCNRRPPSLSKTTQHHCRAPPSIPNTMRRQMNHADADDRQTRKIQPHAAIFSTRRHFVDAQLFVHCCPRLLIIIMPFYLRSFHASKHTFVNIVSSCQLPRRHLHYHATIVSVAPPVSFTPNMLYVAISLVARHLPRSR